MLRRGFTLSERDRVLVVEDVLTTGGSTKETMEVAKAAGAQVVGAASIVDRSGGTARFDVPFDALLELRAADVRARQMSALRARAPGGEAGLAGGRVKLQNCRIAELQEVIPNFFLQSCKPASLQCPGPPCLASGSRWRMTAGRLSVGSGRRNGTSIQGLVEDALRELDEDDVAVAGAGQDRCWRPRARPGRRLHAAPPDHRRRRDPGAQRTVAARGAGGGRPRRCRRLFTRDSTRRPRAIAIASRLPTCSARSSARTRGTCRARWTIDAMAEAARMRRRPSRLRRVSNHSAAFPARPIA